MRPGGVRLAASWVSAAVALAVAACAGDEVLAPAPGATASSTGGAGSAATSGAGGAAGDGGGPAAAVDVVWARRWGGRTTDERIAALVAEPDDAVVVVGTIGALDLVDPPLRAADEEDVLIARFDAAGELVTSRVLGSFGPDAPRSLARRADGTLVLAGTFGTVLDEVDPPLVAFGGPSVFVTALGADLAPTWGAALLGAAVGRGQVAMATTGEGDVVVAGTFAEVLAIGDAVLVNDGEADGFVARFSADGDLAWVLRLEGSGATHLEIGAAAGVDADVIVAAQLEGSLATGGAPIAESLGARRPVLVRVDRDGAVVSAITLRGAGSASVIRLARRPGGLLASLALGGTLLLPEGSLEAAGEGDATLVWTDDDGAPRAGGTWGDRRAQSIGALDVDAAGGIAAAGSFQGALDLGVGSHKAPDGRPDGFVVELTDDGDALRSFTASDPPIEEDRRPGSQTVSGVARLGDGGLALAGAFTGKLLIGDVELDARGDLDAWIARVAPR